MRVWRSDDNRYDFFSVRGPEDLPEQMPDMRLRPETRSERVIRILFEPRFSWVALLLIVVGVGLLRAAIGW
jgi:hypothetical protein